jgi:hypothetical protein
MYLMWNDFAIYWIHRALHHPLLYKPIHKLHHKWLVSSPVSVYLFGQLRALPCSKTPAALCRRLDELKSCRCVTDKDMIN